MSDREGYPGQNWKNYVAHGLNTSITVLLAVLAVNNDVIGTRNDQLETAYQRIAMLEERNAALRGFDIERASMMAELRFKLDKDFEPMTYLQQYLNSVGLPVWIKIYSASTDEFQMLMSSQAYSAVYGVLSQDYEGQNDFAIWGGLASDYDKNDREVLDSKRRKLFVERVRLADGQVVDRKIWKHYIVLPDGRQGVAGIDIGAAEQ